MYNKTHMLTHILTPTTFALQSRKEIASKTREEAASLGGTLLKVRCDAELEKQRKANAVRKMLVYTHSYVLE